MYLVIGLGKVIAHAVTLGWGNYIKQSFYTDQEGVILLPASPSHWYVPLAESEAIFNSVSEVL